VCALTLPLGEFPDLLASAEALQILAAVTPRNVSEQLATGYTD
jgi:hypothetical protein